MALLRRISNGNVILPPLRQTLEPQVHVHCCQASAFLLVHPSPQLELSQQDTSPGCSWAIWKQPWLGSVPCPSALQVQLGQLPLATCALCGSALIILWPFPGTATMKGIMQANTWTLLVPGTCLLEIVVEYMLQCWLTFRKCLGMVATACAMSCFGEVLHCVMPVLDKAGLHSIWKATVKKQVKCFVVLL